MIKDFVVGSMIEEALVVKSASAMETRAKKPYLSIDFFDGSSVISGKYWDWISGKIPEVNDVLDVKAQVTEWQGTKQLTVKSLKTCTTRILADFAPVGEYNLSEIYKGAYSLMSDVKDDTLRTIGLATLEELREKWLTIPGAISIHHNFIGGTLVHSFSVAKIAAAIADAIPTANKDLTVVGAMLHDIGKLFTYKLNGVNIEMTSVGKLYEHLFIGAEFISNFADSHVDTEDSAVAGKVGLLKHIILSHHGEQEYGSPVTPLCIEAYIVHYADTLDATSEQLRKASEATPDTTDWTDKLWALNNRPHMTCRCVDALMTAE